MAAPGYGKRSAPDQNPRREGDFAHLPGREAYLAAFIDRLPDGAAIDTKTLAREQPLYGQQAVRSALRALGAAGHLRRVLENAGGRRIRWVYRTYFSRTARDEAWWDRFLAAVPTDGSSVRLHPSPSPDFHSEERPRPRPQPKPQRRGVLTRPTRSEAYEALASLGRADGRMALSASECEELEGLAAEWLAHGATPAHMTTALTAGLPQTVHCAGALARRRLVAKMPPAPVQPLEDSMSDEPQHILVRIMECTLCGVPGRPDALPGGLCRGCRHEPPDTFRNQTGAEELRSRVEAIRQAMRGMGPDLGGY